MISAWFLSDLHLKKMQERRSQWLLRFLSFLARPETPVTHLFLLGDIFDFWVGDHLFYRNKFEPLFEQIELIKKKNVEIVYFEGNHDLHVQDFWTKRLMIPCHVDTEYVTLGSVVFRLEHGDLINPDDTTYLKFREFVRRPVMKTVADLVPPRVMNWIGDRISQESRKKSSVVRRDSEDSLRQMIRVHAEKRWNEKPFDLIVTGHMHIRDDYSWEASDGRQPRSVNLGSWFDEPLVFHWTETESKWVSVEKDLGSS